MVIIKPLFLLQELVVNTMGECFFSSNNPHFSNKTMKMKNPGLTFMGMSYFKEKWVFTQSFKHRTN